MADPDALRIEVRPYTDEQVQQLVAAVQAEYVVRYGGPDDAAVDPAEFAPPSGLFLVGLVGSEPVATGGWRRVPEQAGTAEIKRMFVVSSARGRGFARRLLAELESTAAQAGVGQVVLNTGLRQPEAVALYESSGYRPIEGFGHYRDMPLALFYGKSLR